MTTKPIILALLLILTACATTTPEEAEYTREDRLNLLLERYYSM